LAVPELKELAPVLPAEPQSAVVWPPVWSALSEALSAALVSEKSDKKTTKAKKESVEVQSIPAAKE
jgi:hypothetical protein